MSGFLFDEKERSCQQQLLSFHFLLFIQLLLFRFLRLFLLRFIAAHLSEECPRTKENKVERDKDEDHNWQDVDHKADEEVYKAF